MSAPTRPAPRRTSAPLGRLVVSELRLGVLRPRTWVTLGVLSVVPLLAAIGMAGVGSRDANVLGVLLVAANEFAAFALVVPVVLGAGDAYATERAHRTLDVLAVAPVGIVRMVVLKASGIVALAALSAAAMNVVALLSGLVLLDLGPYSFGSTLGRALLIALWLTVQLGALGVALLPMSASVRRPVGVIVVGLVLAVLSLPLNAVTVVTGRPNGLIGFLLAILPTGRWLDAVAGLSLSPIDWGGFWSTSLRAAVYLLLGAGATAWLLDRRRS